MSESSRVHVADDGWTRAEQRRASILMFLVLFAARRVRVHDSRNSCRVWLNLQATVPSALDMHGENGCYVFFL